ncbi:MAG: hypothetical protein HY898_08945 [Deltaproteobacteria bacterium]|nr:hypothetical protein [Deltaproteobacteria bacterium]
MNRALLLALFLLPSCTPVPARSYVSPIHDWLTELEHARNSQRPACSYTRSDSARDMHNIACDPRVAGIPAASSHEGENLPALALDGNPATAWRGVPSDGKWEWVLPFRKSVHIGLIRAWFGDSAVRGVPASYRWEFQGTAGAACDRDAPWQLVPGGIVDDRHPNEFVHGSRTIHAQKQVFFADTDVCALRLAVDSVDGNLAPVLRELEVYASARSLARGPGVKVEALAVNPALARSSAEGVIDGRYETFWAGDKGAGKWSLQVTLPEARVVDRVRLLLGYDAVTVERKTMTGRKFSGSHLPLRYRIEVSEGQEPLVWEHLEEADPPMMQAEPLAVRRRLVRLRHPKPVRLLRMQITEATGFWGESDPAQAAPVVREIALYQATDPRPAIHEPLFLSVNANPSALTRRTKHGEAYVDGAFARDAYHRLRRIVVGWDADTRWPADASRPRDDGTGRFLEAIEGDDPTLDRALLVENSPPPLVMLSGGLTWEPGAVTALAANNSWIWNVAAPASSPDRGMGQLGDEVRERAAPFFGFCGGAQILGILQAADSTPDVYDSLLMRNTNEPVRGIATDKKLLERAWWFDKPELDEQRPLIEFDPTDDLFGTLVRERARAVSRAFPSSHYDMLRLSAFSKQLSDWRLSAWSDWCRPWVKQPGIEPTAADEQHVGARCVRIPQAFHSRARDRYPVVGFQFHPEQRDFPRLAPGSSDEERGDALNVFANAVDRAIEAWLRVGWANQ